MINRYPSIVDQRDNNGYTGYDELSNNSRKIIAEYITKRKLNVRKLYQLKKNYI